MIGDWLGWHVRECGTSTAVTLGSQIFYKQTTNGLQQPCSILQQGATTKDVVAVVVGCLLAFILLGNHLLHNSKLLIGIYVCLVAVGDNSACLGLPTCLCIALAC
jgi:hypothetical protein